MKKKFLQQLDINSASASQLASVRGISPILAKRIVAHRPFKKLKELLHVRGVEPDLFNRLSKQLTLKPFIEKKKSPRALRKSTKEQPDTSTTQSEDLTPSSIIAGEISDLRSDEIHSIDQSLPFIPFVEPVLLDKKSASHMGDIETEIVESHTEEVRLEYPSSPTVSFPSEPRSAKLSFDSSGVLWFGLVAVIIVVAFVLIGSSFGFGTSSSQTVMPTIADPFVYAATSTSVVQTTSIALTVTPTRQFFSSAGMAGTGAQIFNEPFDSPKFWDLGDNDLSNIAIANRRLVIRMKQVDSIVWTLNGFSAKDFYYQGTVVSNNCSNNDYFGLVFRSQTEDRRYFFGISCGGRYRVVQQRGQQYQDVIAFTSDSSIIKGSNATNLLAVRAQGSRFVFYINDQEITSLENADSNPGRFGMFSKSTETQSLQVDFDDIAAWEIKP